MWQPTNEQIVYAVDHAGRTAPMESCGLIADGKYIELANTATEHDAFVMDMNGYIEVSKKHRIEAIVHSHIYLPPTPSQGDLAMCEKVGLPWLIVNFPLGTYEVIEPSGFKAPLEGRQWAWGSHDCWGLVRDCFHSETGIWLKDFPRDWMFWEKGDDVISRSFPEAGLRRMGEREPPKHCDIFAMQLVSTVPDHLGIFLEPDIILHQLMGQLSVKEVYGGVYRKCTRYHFRHESQL
jgi:proteasome lid subunit RPN8/RPN11